MGTRKSATVPLGTLGVLVWRDPLSSFFKTFYISCYIYIYIFVNNEDFATVFDSSEPKILHKRLMTTIQCETLYKTPERVYS